LQWDGEEVTGDIWPGIEADVEELRLKAKAMSMKETGTLHNIHKDIAHAKPAHEVDCPVHLHTLSLIIE
jgi:hypothetical protein